MSKSSNTTTKKNITSYLDWATIGKASTARYIVGSLSVLFISLFVGQMFSVLGKTIIPYDSAGATIIKTTFFGFIFSFLAIPALVRILHNRPWWSVAMPKLSFDKHMLLAGILSALVFKILHTLFFYLHSPNTFIYSGVNLSEWAVMFVLAAIAFFVQASTEEMVYRGYLTQFVYKFSRNPILLFVIPALVFSYPHYGNIEGAHGFVALIPYIVMSSTYFWLAYRGGSLWAAVGAHMASNWFITMFVGSQAETIQKVSLFLVPASEMTVQNMIEGVLISTIGTIIIFELILWKFKLATPLPIARLLTTFK